MTRSKGKTISVIKWKKVALRAAAAITLLLSLAVLQRYVFQENSFVAKETPVDESMIPELVEAQTYYGNMVSNRLAEVEVFLVDNPELAENLKYDLSLLDTVYTELKEDLKDGIANEEVVDAMIQNYRLKLEILEDLLFQLQKTNQSGESGQNEDVDDKQV